MTGVGKVGCSRSRSCCGRRHYSEAACGERSPTVALSSLLLVPSAKRAEDEALFPEHAAAAVKMRAKMVAAGAAEVMLLLVIAVTSLELAVVGVMRMGPAVKIGEVVLALLLVLVDVVTLMAGMGVMSAGMLMMRAMLLMLVLLGGVMVAWPSPPTPRWRLPLGCKSGPLPSISRRSRRGASGLRGGSRRVPGVMPTMRPAPSRCCRCPSDTAIRGPPMRQPMLLSIPIFLSSPSFLLFEAERMGIRAKGAVKMMGVTTRCGGSRIIVRRRGRRRCPRRRHRGARIGRVGSGGRR